MPAEALRRAFRGWGRWYARRRIARGLDGVRVTGLEATRERLSRGPLILAANHVCWWDALLIVDLSPRLGARARVLVDAERLAQHRFFLPFGAVAAQGSGPAALRRTLGDLAAGLAGPGDALWWFPQGRYRPAHLRPLGLRPGVDVVARKAGAPIVPVSLQYAFLQADRPAAFVSFGEPVEDLAGLEAGLAAGLDAIDAEVLAASAVPAPVGTGTRLLSWLAGGLGEGRG